MTVITSTVVELLWLEFKDMKILWERNKEMMESAVTALGSLPNLN
ncbi:unnamed protein product, partial [Lymnaea stagnalis]